MLGNLEMIFPNTQQSRDVGCTPSAPSRGSSAGTLQRRQEGHRGNAAPGGPSSLLQEPGPARLNYPKRPSGIWPKA